MIYQIYGADAHQMTKALMETAGVIQRIPAGASVALKPNLVVAGTPESGATTHGGVLSGCIEYLQEHGVKEISVIEGSWVGDDTGRAMRACGYDKVCRRYDVPFYDLKRDKTRRVNTPLRSMDICQRALDAGYLIDLPVLKGHCQTRMTCALKNLKGCIPDQEKRRFHTEGLTRPIAALAAALKPHLIIVDNICGDLDFEEGGNPVYTGRMYLGFDPVQIDAYGCRLMGLPLSDVPYIQLAEQFGAGSTALEASDLVSLNEPATRLTAPVRSRAVERLTKHVHQDSACSACFASLVRALYELDRAGVRISQEISIGQGWKGKKPKGIGIGSCCAGAAVCVKGCPPTAKEIAETAQVSAFRPFQ